jgi:hypothetical protein
LAFACNKVHIRAYLYIRLFQPFTSIRQGKRLSGPFDPSQKLRAKMFTVTPDAKHIVYGGAWDASIRVFSLGKIMEFRLCFAVLFAYILAGTLFSKQFCEGQRSQTSSVA